MRNFGAAALRARARREREARRLHGAPAFLVGCRGRIAPRRGSRRLARAVRAPVAHVQGDVRRLRAGARRRALAPRREREAERALSKSPANAYAKCSLRNAAVSIRGRELRDRGVSPRPRPRTCGPGKPGPRARRRCPASSVRDSWRRCSTPVLAASSFRVGEAVLHRAIELLGDARAHAREILRREDGVHADGAVGIDRGIGLEVVARREGARASAASGRECAPTTSRPAMAFFC